MDAATAKAKLVALLRAESQASPSRAEWPGRGRDRTGRKHPEYHEADHEERHLLHHDPEDHEEEDEDMEEEKDKCIAKVTLLKAYTHPLLPIDTRNENKSKHYNVIMQNEVMEIYICERCDVMSCELCVSRPAPSPYEGRGDQ